MFLYRYYDKKTVPFRNLSDLPIDDANRVLDTDTLSFTYGDSHPL